MLLTLFISLTSLVVLVSLHELGHFLTAKKFGVRVEEFGLGYPPRVFGKKIGETLYSLNLLPFGAFVRIPEESGSDRNLFLNKPVWQRSLIVFNGALVFWIVAILLFSIVFLNGARVAIDDSEIVSRATVLISGVANNTPAQEAGLKPGDAILKIEGLDFDKVNLVQEFVNDNKGREITLTVQRDNDVIEIKVTPRINPPSGQGPLGISLLRIGLKTYPWYLAGWQGLKATLSMTWQVVLGFGHGLVQVFKGGETGIQLMGPVGILGVLNQGVKMGIVYFLQMIGLLSVNVAVLNLLPIPAFDGGKLLFLGIEALRKKPVSRQVEEKITTFFFILLIILMIFVSIKDIRNLF